MARKPSAPNGASTPHAARRTPQGSDRAPNDVWRDAFLAAFRDSANVRLACARAGVARSTFYAAKEADTEFAAAVEDARQDACDVLEARAREGATAGFEKVITYQGQVTETVREVHPQLLMFLLKAHRREVYGDKLEASGPGGGPIPHAHTIDLRECSEEELALYEQLALLRAARAGGDPGGESPA